MSRILINDSINNFNNILVFHNILENVCLCAAYYFNLRPYLLLYYHIIISFLHSKSEQTCNSYGIHSLAALAYTLLRVIILTVAPTA